ncbi:hypothetical protein GCM10010149_89260 [Nonomuraea roseoviolacea subsp. roseoviolacea]|uniref:hypothetical protein n=1 Tax=Nonomuraea roseoviolacea TaxID=103837 RepID=UPI0031D948FB
MSRYEDAQPTYAAYRGKLTRVLPLRKTPSQAFRFTMHMVEAGERIDLLADSYVGDSQNWHIIADVNPEQMWFGDLEPGTVLRIPYV